ncbi:ubiquitin-like protein [Serratia sp. NPDC078593]|uniref:ubiquitin-like protein n=1 Tax=unclassified Serratia (in: enterobacteria) TaxID=2647522 RepID=UPI0037D81352
MNNINLFKKILIMFITSLALLPQLVLAMQISIVTLTGTNHALTVNPTDSITAVKEKFADKQGIPVDQQKLFFNNNQLENSKTLTDYGIGDGSKLKLELRLKAG